MLEFHKKQVSEPFLCIITPTFDIALPSVKLLISDLHKQSCQDFIHICISNGLSPQTKVYIQSLGDPRFIYDEIVEEQVNKIPLLVANLGKRRELCLKKYNAARYVFLDADIKLLDINYFKKLRDAHDKAAILVTQVVSNDFTIFPTKQTFEIGTFDIANFSFAKWVAKWFHYPTNYLPEVGIANDWRFFHQIKEAPKHFLFFVSAEKNGNSTYKSVTEESRIPRLP